MANRRGSQFQWQACPITRQKTIKLVYSTQALLWSSANKSVFLARQGPVAREVTRILTPGTVTDDAFVDSGQELWVASLHSHGLTYSVALGSVSRGEILMYDQLSRQAIDSLFTRIEPKECLTQNVDLSASEIRQVEAAPWHFTLEQLSREIERTYQVTDARGLGLSDVSAQGLEATAALLTYLHDTQRTELTHFKA